MTIFVHFFINFSYFCARTNHPLTVLGREDSYSSFPIERKKFGRLHSSQGNFKFCSRPIFKFFNGMDRKKTWIFRIRWKFCPYNVQTRWIKILRFWAKKARSGTPRNVVFTKIWKIFEKMQKSVESALFELSIFDHLKILTAKIQWVDKIFFALVEMYYKQSIFAS